MDREQTGGIHCDRYMSLQGVICHYERMRRVSAKTEMNSHDKGRSREEAAFAMKTPTISERAVIFIDRHIDGRRALEIWHIESLVCAQLHIITTAARQLPDFDVAQSLTFW